MASMGLNLEEQKAVDRFRKNVAEPSMTSLVILDFWAEWCGPCKALSPVLEKVAADYADKGVILAKVNVDEEQFIAAQFQVKSIPTVYAVFQGQPVADLTQARSESQLKAILEDVAELKVGFPKTVARLQASAEGSGGLGKPPEHLERDAEVVVRVGVVGLELNGPLQHGCRLCVPAKIDERHSQVVVALGIVRVE